MRRKVVGVFLAAGSSKRMGRNKLELKLDADHRLGGYALTEALSSRLDGIVIVVRPGDPLEWLPRLAFGNLMEEGGRFQLLWDYVALSENGIPKPPILLSGSMIPAVDSLQGDSGARLLLQNDSFRGKLIAAPDPRCFWDADTPEDWLRILTEYEQLKVNN